MRPGHDLYMESIIAVDLNTGRKTWQVENEQPMIAGALATAGNVALVGEANGAFRAFDARNGKTFWSFQGRAGCNTPPVTY